MTNEQEQRPKDPSVETRRKSAEVELSGEMVVSPIGAHIDLVSSSFNLPDTMDVLGEQWVRKKEFHVTLVGPKQRLAKRFQELHPDIAASVSRRQVRQAVSVTAEGKSFSVRPGNEIRVVQEGDKKTIVRMVEVEGMERFFEELEARLGFFIDRPPTHVTLYTLENGKPIGLHSKDELERLACPLAHADNQRLKKALGLVDVTGSAYGWGKTARLMSEDIFLDILARTEGDFVFVDLCSALSIFPQMMRERHKERCYVKAKKISGEVAAAIQLPPQKIPDAFGEQSVIEKSPPGVLRRLRETLAPQKALARKIITSIIQEVLYTTPTLNGSEEEQEARLVELFLKSFESSDIVYEDVFELREKVGRGGWEIKVPCHTGVTVRDELKSVLGEVDGDIFAKTLAFFIAKKSLPHIRGFQIVSVDVIDPNILREEGQKSFPKGFRSTEFYRRIEGMENHVRADVSQLPLQKDSVNFFTSFEGWPFYRTGSTASEMRLARNISESLKPGGKAFFFPWLVQGHTSEDEQRLETIKAYWQSLGLTFTTQEYSRQHLIEVMGDRELVLVDHSPVFAEPTDAFQVLVLEKPKAVS